MGKRTNTATWSDKHSRWQVNVQNDGKRRSFYSCTQGRTGQREANAKADAWLDDGIENTNQVIRVVYNEFLKSKEQTTSKSNYLPMNTRYNNHIGHIIGHLKLINLNEHHLQNVINTAYSEKKLASKSLQNIRADLTAFLKYCRKRKLTTLTIEDLTIPSQAKRSNKNILQPSDLQVLFESNKTSYLKEEVVDTYINAYRFQVLTGLRPGELMALTWNNIDFKKRLLHVCGSINAHNEETNGKNENAIRTSILSDIAIDLLKQQRLVTGFNKNIFPIESQRLYYSQFKRYCRYNKIKEVSPYELRHTFVSILNSLPEAQVKFLVGHSKNMDTFGTYGHTVDGELEAIAINVSKAFSNILKQA